MYASYATFHPGKKGSIDRAVDWLADAYVHRLYKGKVLTDFDEVTRRFPGATFTLSKILDNKVNLEEALKLDGQIERLKSGLEQVHFNIVSMGAGPPLSAIFPLAAVAIDRLSNLRLFPSPIAALAARSASS